MSRTTVSDLTAKAEAGEPITMLTAYDAEMARIVDSQGVDVILVGDSMGNNQLGYDSTLPVTIDEALTATKAVSRSVTEAMVVGDLPFMSVGASLEQSVENAGRFMKEADADAVKLETSPGGTISVEVTNRLVELGVPVMGHIGFTPQHLKQFGGHVVQGRESEGGIKQLIDTAKRLEVAGVFSIVLEAVTEAAAERITNAVDVPTIGIGAGREVDGQVLVINDVIGLGSYDLTFNKQYADVESIIANAVSEYVTDIEAGAFPTEEHIFKSDM